MIVYIIIFLLSSLLLYQVYAFFRTEALDELPDDLPDDVPDDVPTDLPTDVPMDVPMDLPMDLPTDLPDVSPYDPQVNTQISPTSVSTSSTMLSGINGITGVGMTPNITGGLPIQTSTTIETNMLYLNNHINDLQAKYLLLDSKMNKIQEDAKNVTDQQNAASEIVGDKPFVLDTSS